MARVEPTLVPVLVDLDRGLRELGVTFGIVGALVPELLLEARPARMTNDADVMVVVQTVDEFDTLKDRLAEYRFERTRLAHRLRHTSGGLLDILPYSESVAPGDRLQLDSDLVFNMAGFRHVVFDGAGVPYDYTCAHLLGLDARPLLDASISNAVRNVLDRFDEPDAHLVGIAAAESRRTWVDNDRRTQVFELFRWYRRGTGL